VVLKAAQHRLVREEGRLNAGPSEHCAVLTGSLKLLQKRIYILAVREGEANLILKFVFSTSHKGQPHSAPVVKEKHKTVHAQNRNSLPKFTFAVITLFVVGVVLVKLK
jgi:hypothetical protein